MRRSTVFILFLFIASCIHARPQYTNQGPRDISSPGPYKHKYFNVEFPEKALNFIRVNVLNYDYDEKDISVGYNSILPDRKVALTIYIYPQSPAFPQTKESYDSHFEVIKSSLLRTPRSYKNIGESYVMPITTGQILYGKNAIYSYEETVQFSIITNISEVYLYVDKDWFIKYRITYPEIFQHNVKKDLGELFSYLKLPYVK